MCSKDFENVSVLRFSHTILTGHNCAKYKVMFSNHSKDVILPFYNRLKTLKKEINMAEQQAEDRKKKKQEISKSSATKPKRLGKHQYPTCTLHVLCTPPPLDGSG